VPVILTIELLAAALAFHRRCRAAALFLLLNFTSEVLRLLWRAYVLNFAGPYTGAAFWLFLVDVALFCLPAAVLMQVVGKRLVAIPFWLGAILYVALKYPTLRGEALVSYYSALYLAVYAAVFICVLIDSALRGKMLRDEFVLLLLVVPAAASTSLILLFGSAVWWSCWITNGASYASAVVAALRAPQD
jgi:hypothetical protein